MSPKLILIDGHSLAYRAYFAMVNTSLSIENAQGEKEMTGAVFAFTNMLLKVWRDEKPDYLAVAFDVGRTFRDDLFADYKGTREKMPDELVQQMSRIQSVVRTFDIPIFTADGFEADDVIGTLARRASSQGMHVVIVTGDRDALQLVNPLVHVLTSRQRFEDTILYDEPKVQEIYGIRPDQIIDYKALVGDTSDNVPGVRGIGEKSAQALLQQHETLDRIYTHLDEITQKRARAALEAGRDSAYLSRTLVTIRTDVPLDVNWDACTAHYDAQRIVALFRELNFKSLLPRLPVLTSTAAPAESLLEEQGSLFSADEPATRPTPPPAQHAAGVIAGAAAGTASRLVASDEDFKALLTELNTTALIAFDTETTGTDPLRSEAVGLSFSVREGEAWYLPLAGSMPTLLDTETWQLDPTSPKFEPIAQALLRPGAQLVAHNAKYDLEVLRMLGVQIDKPVYDTMLAQFLCDPGGRGLGLKQMAFDYLGWQMTEITELIGKGRKQITMREVPIAQAAAYAAADADATLRLWHLLEPKLAQRSQAALFHEVEVPLIHVLTDMEMAGVALDVKYLGELSSEITARLRELEKNIYESAGSVFNINSPKQLGDVLFGKLGLPAQSRTSTGALSTSAEVLDELRDKHDVVPLLLEHRELSKLQGTYVEALPRMINPATGRLHTDFNQAGAVTGRLSSSNPNLQNIPNKSEMGHRVRKAFIPRAGWSLISADYSQVELRILAHMADDPTMKDAFARGEDIHATTAAVIYDTPLKDVTSMQRSNAKRINFGIAYGMGPQALAAGTGMTFGEAQAFIQRYFERFPRVHDWLANTKQIAAEQGYVETLLGRRRYFPELQHGAPEQMKRRAEREAINHPVQGSAADIMKIAMIRIHNALKTQDRQARMTLQVHDELVFDCPPHEISDVCTLVRSEMENAYPLSVHLRADVGIGKSWDDVA
ncbi:MAG: DNA polymerase I [Chloroflexi bacterium]|nr:DNA polymerase I [Chloroflexota bacterium]